jgi:hypothetical protein
MMCFLYDSSLITAFLDRWRLDTHSFRLPVGEMTVSLEDVAMLFSLPLGVVAIVAIDVPNTWRLDFLIRFTNVPRNDHAPQPY